MAMALQGTTVVLTIRFGLFICYYSGAAME